MTEEELTPVKEGISDYARHIHASAIKQDLERDPELAKQILAWLRLKGYRLTDY